MPDEVSRGAKVSGQGSAGRRVVGLVAGAMVLMSLASCGGAVSQGAGDSPTGIPLNLAACTPGPAGSPVPGGLPDITLDCLGHGPAVRVGSLRGPAVLNMWASWCAPCQQETPALQSAHEAQGARIRFLGVDTRDDSGAALGFLRAERVTYAQLSDPSGTLAASLGTPGLPTTVAIDATGKIVWRKAGQLHAADLRAAISAVAEKGSP
ncbi:MAG: TlpA family protein disulfide reductase [Pseudonocardiaceae bacterium]